MFSKNLVKSAFIVLITLFIFLLLFIKIDLQEMARVLVSIDLRFFILAVFVSIFSNIFVAADKWRRILKEVGCSITFKEALLILNGSDPISFISPLKSGELAAKAIYLKRRKNLGFEYGMGLVMLEKALNLFGTLIILCVSLFFYKINFLRICGLAPFALIILVVSIDLKNITASCVGAFKKNSIKMYNFIKRINAVFSRISPKRKIYLLAYSTFFQLTELITAYILFNAAGLTIPLYSIFIYIPIVVLLANIPITISGLGTREAAIVFLFFRYGSPELLLIVGILISFIEYILPAIIGLFFLPTFVKKAYGLKFS